MSAGVPLRATLLHRAMLPILLLAAPATGTVHHFVLDSPPPLQVPGPEGVSVLMEGAPSLGHPGEPLLPKLPLVLLLPPGERVLDVEVAPSEERILGRGLRPLIAQPPARVAARVANPVALTAYVGLEAPEGDRDFGDLDYLIVCGDPWMEPMEEYADFLRSRGLRTGLFSRSWVLEEYNGRDTQEAIRNFARQAYQESQAEYLLLVGDARDENGIPHRGLFCQSYSTTDYDLPGDIYYGALDGDWNDDGDGRWGEPGEDDLYPELAVGRACVSDLEDVQNFIRKNRLYQGSPVVHQMDRVLMVGEQLWADPLTWGGDYKDEIRHGSNANGLVTLGVPSSMAVGTLYERDWSWQKEHLLNILSDGVNLVNHQGHAFYNLAAQIHVNDLVQLDNDGAHGSFCFFYSQGCYCGSFDNKASYGGYYGDCFAEELTLGEGGAVAAVMNSRYGWGDAGGTAGPSQFFDREFYAALFRERIREAGRANDDSKMDLAWMADYPGMRWCHYDLNLFGDPAMKIWTARPEAMELKDVTGLAVGSRELGFKVRGPLGGLVGAVATLHSSDLGLLETAVSGFGGAVRMEFPPLEAGRYTLTVLFHDFVPYRKPHWIRDYSTPGDEPAEGGQGGDGAWGALQASPVTALHPNQPNPFNPSTELSFRLAEAGLVSLIIFDVEGRRVRSLIEGVELEAGEHAVLWDGRDESGRSSGSGLYFAVLSAEEHRCSRKLLLLK